MNILIADDIDQTELAESLRKDGHTVYLAHDGVEALLLWNTYKIDRLLTDLNMPNMDGLELIEEIKKQGKGDAKIILYSGNSMPIFEKIVKRKGGDLFVGGTMLSDAMNKLRKAFDELNPAT